MKIQSVNDTDYIIYMFSRIEKDEIKDKIKNIQKRLKLSGFYRVRIVNKNIGCFLKLIRLENSFYKDTLDLKIEEVDEDIYFVTNDYFIIKECSTIMYYDEMFYCIVDDSFDKILEKVEFGDFVFSNDINKSECYVI